MLRRSALESVALTGPQQRLDRLPKLARHLLDIVALLTRPFDERRSWRADPRRPIVEELLRIVRCDSDVSGNPRQLVRRIGAKLIKADPQASTRNGRITANQVQRVSILRSPLPRVTSDDFISGKVIANAHRQRGVAQVIGTLLRTEFDWPG